MTVLTDVGREYLDDLQYGRVSDPIDTIAVGIGDAPESAANTDLDEQIYESTVDNANVEFEPVPETTAATYASIDIRGGHEVPANSEITEMGIFCGPEDVLVYRDVQNAQIVESGVQITLRLRLDTEAL